VLPISPASDRTDLASDAGCHTQRSMVVEVPTQMSDEKPSTTLPGALEKIFKSWVPDEPENAQIVVLGADHLYGD
jgi:hypothetical protein